MRFFALKTGHPATAVAGAPPQRVQFNWQQNISRSSQQISNGITVSECSLSGEMFLFMCLNSDGNTDSEYVVE